MTVFFLLLSMCMPVDDLTVGEIAAGFRQNAQSTQTIRAQWLVSKVAAPAARLHQEQALGELQSLRQQAIDKGEAFQYTDAIRRAESDLLYSDDETSLFCQMDYWSDRDNFQARCQRNPRRDGHIFFEGIDLISFPDLEATPENLFPGLMGLNIVSYGEATENSFRTWTGNELFPGSPAGHFQSEFRRDSDGYFPPLSFPERSWLGVPHIIDKFLFACEGDQASILGTVVVDGVNTLLVEAFGDKSCYRGFVDVNRGMLPLRVEEFYCDDVDKFRSVFQGHVDICLRHPRLGPAFICKDIQIEDIRLQDGAAAYYPTSGVTQRIHRCPSPEFQLSPELHFLSVHDVTSWVTHMVEFGREMSKENFRMTFPKGTIFGNSDAREVWVAGGVGESAKRFVAGAQNFNPRPRSYGRWVIIGAIALAGLLATVVWRRRRAGR